MRRLTKSFKAFPIAAICMRICMLERENFLINTEKKKYINHIEYQAGMKPNLLSELRI